MHEALTADVPMTKRFVSEALQRRIDIDILDDSDMYYRDVALFGSQAVVDRVLSSLLMFLQVT